MERKFGHGQHDESKAKMTEEYNKVSEILFHGFL
jgi:hypothetical protein